MKTKIQIKTIYGKILFEYEKENNTVKDTLEEAVKNNSDISDAILINADLSYANLYNANLRNAALSGANLRNVKNKELANLPIFCKWSFSIKGDLINIGCKSKTIKDWGIWFDSKEEYETQRNTEEFKQIQAVYNALKTYLETLNK